MGQAPDSTRQPMISFRGVKTGYGHMEVLHGIDLDVYPGEVVTLLGSNGAGKTTTLMTLSGINRVWAGEIWLRPSPDEEPVALHKLASHEIVKRGICHAPEGRQIFRDLTVRENLHMGAFLRNDAGGIAEDLAHMYELFPRLKEREWQLGGTLSGGEQQMLAIARALMGKPKVLLLDEPSLGLAPLLVQDIFETITRVNQEEGVTVLLVEQNANQALHVAHRAYVLETGTITLSGDAKELAGNPEIQKAYLGI